MEANYRFFSNKACQYFPCHQTITEETFNCLFCYCPLYYIPNCGGKFTLNKGIKDCSQCLIPHSPKGYDYINRKIKEMNKIKRDMAIKEEGGNACEE